VKVLIAIDDSPSSAMAVAAVVARIWPKSTHFRVICVLDTSNEQYAFAGGPAVVDAMFDIEQELAEQLQQLVHSKVSLLKAAFEKDTVSGEVFKGEIVGTIIDTAKQWNADLIVVGTHERKGVQKLFLSSVASEIAHRAPCSVEIVRS
jgi:nucleotide-binding universal stress UspA family protein